MQQQERAEVAVELFRCRSASSQSAVVRWPRIEREAMSRLQKAARLGVSASALLR